MHTKRVKKSKTLFSVFIVLILLIFSANNRLSAQNLSKTVSIIAKNKTLRTVLEELSQKTGIEFSYSSNLIDTEKKITLIARRKNVEDVFAILFIENNIQYVLVENKVILKPKTTPVPKNQVENLSTKKNYTLSGFVRDPATGESVIGASIAINGTSYGTVTNDYGFYSLSLKEGNYNAEFSFLGCEKHIEAIQLYENKKLDISLKTNETELSVVVVNNEDKKNVFTNNPTHKMKLSREEIRRSTLLAGEADVVKSLLVLPGFQSSGDGSVMYNVRGGNRDQNIIFIDEAPVYNPSHLLGFFSAISPEAVNSMNVYKSNFPIEYGGMLSSITDIKTKEGNKEIFGFSGKIDPVSVSYTFDGPFKKQRSSYFFTYRKSHISALFGDYMTTEKVSFYDIHLKLNFKIGKKNHLYFSFYNGYDLIKNKQIDTSTRALSWKNLALSLRFNHIYTEKIFSNTTVYLGKYDYFLYSSYEKDKYWNSNISDLSVKNDITFYLSPKNTVKTGININNHQFNPGNYNDEYYFVRKISERAVSEFVFYLGTEIGVFEKLKFNSGLRLIAWNNIGPSIIYTFDSNRNIEDTLAYENGIYHSSFHFEPRLALFFELMPNLSVKASYERTVQNLNLLSNSASPLTSLDVWLPSGPNIKAQKADQFSLSFFKKTAEFELSIEAFYKKMFNQIKYVNHANLLLNPYIESEIRTGTSRAYGAEALLMKRKGDITGAVSYSYSRVFTLVEGLNSNKEYPETYDRPHKLSLNIDYKYGKRWYFSLAWIYSSGTRFSSPTGFYHYRGYNVPLYAERNNSRLPAYHRMDFALTFKLSKPEKRYINDITLSIFNVYNRKNIVAVNFTKIETDDGAFVVPSDYVKENELVPVKMYFMGIVPSLTYSYSFR